MMFAKAEIRSYNRQLLYANAGDEVTILYKNGDVLICEGNFGKFPCKIDRLTEIKALEDNCLDNLKSTMSAEIKKNRQKFRSLYLAIKEGLITKQMPDNITKEQWIKTAESLLCSTLSK